MTRSNPIVGVRRALTLLIVLPVAFAALLALVSSTWAQPPPYNLEPLSRYEWGGWESLGNTTRTKPECLSAGANRIDCFVVGTDNTLWRRWYDGAAWRPWERVVGLTVQPAYLTAHSCVSWGAGRVDCFVRDPSNAMFHRWWDDGTSDGWWEDLGGTLGSDPECVSTAPRRIDCFARWADGTMRQRSFDGNIWQPWENRFGDIAQWTKPSCVARDRNRIDCVATATDSQLRHIEFDRNWSGWNPMPGGRVSAAFATNADVSPKCIAMSDVEIRCFAPTVGPISGIPSLSFWVKSSGPTWGIGNLGSDMGGTGAYQQFGGVVSYDFDCVLREGDRVDCMELVGRRSGVGFSTGPLTLQLRHFSWSTASTEPWSVATLGGTPVSGENYGLSCLKWGGDRIDCFVSAGWFSSSALLHAWNSERTPLARPFRPR